jgi:hypothetical protein
MLGNRRLVIDSFSEVINLLKPWMDETFWDFSTVELTPNTIYVIGRQQLINNIARVKDMAASGLYTVIFSNSAEGSWTLESQIKQLKLEELAQNKQILFISGAEISPDFACLSHEHFLPSILDYEENIAVQGRTDEIFSKTIKPYKFLFLNGRARPHRKYLYERFKRNGLLDQSLWTMLDAKPTVVRSFTFCENDINVMATPSTLQRLPDAYEVDRYKQPTFGPIVLDQTNLKQELFRQEWGEIYLAAEPYIDTYFSLITETICAESTYSFRTEKIAKPLAMAHPFVIASNAGFYRDLRNLGFRTFDGIIDESFDSIQNAQARMDRIVAVVDDLCRADLSAFLRACEPVCKYNQQHLAELRLRVRKEFPEQFFQFLNRHNIVHTE